MGFRPSVPPDMHVGLRMLMEDCWHASPERRPSFAAVLMRLRVRCLPMRRSHDGSLPPRACWALAGGLHDVVWAPGHHYT